MSHLLHRRFAPILGLAALLQACGGNVSVDAGETVIEPLPQGIFGTVTRSTGDFFCCPSHGTTEPIAVPVHIIRGTVPFENGKPPPALADLPVEISVQSTIEGTYAAGLLPGTYTVFIEVDGELYRNCYSDATTPDSYCPTEVVAGVFTKASIDDNDGATY